ncbi:zinc finger protein 16-like isoform X2 [Periplaneta americana]|uniref:zinc finger protein 16-like isoform X2 n=1 Tax=Periplaneta americana TaxID=6978 RepID=UPI0037E896CC
MAGYRRVNYYELCRLCTSSEGTKMHIFREEGRRRQLPTKIQICLPLQVCEDDSLPKIICSHCVDKLESFYDFRESCVNAEAMLESYFTSLRYSDDFTREGKVYVKDESPPKKKATTSVAVATTANSDTEKNQHNKAAALTAATDGLNSLVQAASIQIVSDADGTRVQQYKCAMQMQPGSAGATVVEAAATEARYSYECTAANTRTTESNPVVAQMTVKVEDGSTQCSETDFANKVVSARHHQSPESSEEGDVSAQQQQQQTAATAVAFTTAGPGQEMLVHFNFNKDRETLFRPEEHVALQRSSIAQIGEFLRMKSVNIIDGTAGPTATLVEVAAAPNPPARPCERCGKIFTTLEELHSHSPCNCATNQESENTVTDKNASNPAGSGGNFGCEICGKPFKRKEHLFQHRKLHTGERPYVCVSCGKAFSRKEHLVRHAVSHTGQKMHGCDLCGKSFSRKDNLHKHRKTHGIAGPYICETCGKSFVVKHYYLMHRGSHATPGSSMANNDGTSEGNGTNSTAEISLPYKCDICSKGFAMKQYLITHKQRHRNKNQQQQIQGGQAATNTPSQVQVENVGTTETNVASALSHNNVPLTTINNSALLAPNILHHVTTQPSAGATAGNNSATAAMIQVSSAAATAYLCTPATVAANELLETYRRLHSA